MTMLFIDGFEGGDFSTKWDFYSSKIVTSTITRFNEGMSLKVVLNVLESSGVKKNFTASNKVTIGFAMKDYKGGYDPHVSLYGDSGSTVHLNVALEGSDNHIVVRRGGITGTRIATGSTSLGDRWFYIEIQAVISDTVGSVEIRLNGSKTPEIKLTDIDTKNGGTNDSIDAIRFSGGTSTVNTGTVCYIDDLYILNDVGSENNDFLGDLRIRTLTPNGNGTYSQMVGSDSDQVDNYALVDELPCNSTDYVGSSSSGHKDTYHVGDCSFTPSTIYAVQNNIYSAKSDATTGSNKTAMLIGGVLYYGSDNTLAETYANYRDIYDCSPDTALPWTVDDINNMEVGSEVI